MHIRLPELQLQVANRGGAPSHTGEHQVCQHDESDEHPTENLRTVFIVNSKQVIEVIKAV